MLGPNGSGKTTLLRIASGYLWPTSGRVLRLGKELIDLGELRRSIGWISSDLDAPHSGRRHGPRNGRHRPARQIGLKPLSALRADRRRLRRLPPPSSPDLECESLADKPFGILSQGERQQVLMARARMAGPLLLVLDEPCAGMDPGVRERFLAWLNDRVAAPDSPTVVLVTHHVEEIVPRIANTLILHAGRVHRAGPTHDVVTRETIEAVYNTRLARIERSGGRLWPIWG